MPNRMFMDRRAQFLLRSPNKSMRRERRRGGLGCAGGHGVPTTWAPAPRALHLSRRPASAGRAARLQAGPAARVPAAPSRRLRSGPAPSARKFHPAPRHPARPALRSPCPAGPASKPALQGWDGDEGGGYRVRGCHAARRGTREAERASGRVRRAVLSPKPDREGGREAAVLRSGPAACRGGGARRGVICSVAPPPRLHLPPSIPPTRLLGRGSRRRRLCPSPPGGRAPGESEV